MEIEFSKNSALGRRRPQVLIKEKTLSPQDLENTPKALPTKGICPGVARTCLQVTYIPGTAGDEGCFSQSSPRNSLPWGVGPRPLGCY